MVFKIKQHGGYSTATATEALGDDNLYLVGKIVETQYEYIDNKPTKNVTGYQVWVATDNQNPFKVKFLEDKPDLSGLAIGDVVVFDQLEAIQIKSNVYFRATGIQKG
ncbi:hypothetical protein [uncultured Streptococcus sp.]|mgnify:CR=1 FL=1|uniref:hypothetical protein n=1 Tax=uncultured Streptococcus sp. TaxID=83427 RepID=UPI0027DCA7E0|nr:hypothetical protein [uncultured Streptococcus sp.]